jgi:hypothetical protein
LYQNWPGTFHKTSQDLDSAPDERRGAWSSCWLLSLPFLSAQLLRGWHFWLARAAK